MPPEMYKSGGGYSSITDQNPELLLDEDKNSGDDSHTPQTAIVRVSSQQEEVQFSLQSIRRELVSAEEGLADFRKQFPHLSTQILSHSIHCDDLRKKIKELEHQQEFLGKLERRDQGEFLQVQADLDWHVGLVENLPVPHTKVDKAAIALSAGTFIAAIVSVPLAGIDWIYLMSTLYGATLTSMGIAFGWTGFFGSHGLPFHSVYKKAIPIEVFKKYKEAKESGEFDLILVASRDDSDFTGHGSARESVLLGVVKEHSGIRFFRKRKGKGWSCNYAEGTAQIKDIKEVAFYEIARWGTSAESKSSA